MPGALMDTPMVEHGICYRQTMTSTEVQQCTNRVQIGQAISSNHAFSLLFTHPAN